MNTYCAYLTLDKIYVIRKIIIKGKTDAIKKVFDLNLINKLLFV